MHKIFVILAFLVSANLSFKIFETYNLTQPLYHEGNTIAIWAFNRTIDERDTGQNDTTVGTQKVSTQSATDIQSLGSTWGYADVIHTQVTLALPVATNSDLSTTTARKKLRQSSTYRQENKIASSTESQDSTVSLSISDKGNDSDLEYAKNAGTLYRNARLPGQEECAVMNYWCVPGCNSYSGETEPCSCGMLCKKPDECCTERAEECLSMRGETGVLTHCIENKVLVSSCDKDFNRQVFNELKERSTSSTLGPFLRRMSYSDILLGCNSSDDLLQSLPVTDSITSVQYRNIFCAICNSASGDIRFWDGHLYCPQELSLQASSDAVSKITSVFQNIVSLDKLVGDTKERRCVALLRPKHGTSQMCFVVESMDSKLEGHKAEYRASKPKRSIYKAKPDFEMFLLRFDETKSSVLLTKSKVLSKQLLLQSFIKLVDITKTSDRAIIMERCLQIKPYIHECSECRLYFQLLECIHLVGEPDDETQLPNGCSLEEKQYGETSFVQEAGQIFITDPPPSPEKNRTRVVRGNVYQQMDRFVNILISQVNLSKTKVACNMTSYQNVKGERSNQYFTHLYFRCEVENQTLTFEEVELTDGDADQDPKVSQILKFAEKSVRVLANATDSVKLPLNMEASMCVVLFQTTTPNSFCLTINMGWSVQRIKNGIVGNIPLEGLITIICCALSITGLLFRLAFQNIVTVYKSYPGKVQFSLCLSLLLSYCFFLVGGMVADSSLECRIVGMMTHFAFLSALFWMNVTAFEIWRTFRHWSNQVVSRGKTSLAIAGMYAVGVPAMIVIGALIVEELDPTSDFSPEYGAVNCWLNGGFAVAVYFVAPCSILCCFNVLFVGLTLRGLRRQRTAISEVKFSSSLTAINDTTIVVKISLLVGITWLLGLLAAVVNTRVLWIIFTLINASLGLFISIVLVCNKRVYLAVKAKCLCYNSDSVVSTQVKKH